jgi:hypothetical protein
MAYDSGNTPPLSTSAQTVFDAAWNLPVSLGDIETTRLRQIAAALRAAADQVVPEQEPWHRTSDANVAKHEVRLEFLAIANELDGIAKTET